MGMRGVRGQLFVLGGLAVVLSCGGRTTMDDGVTFDDGTRGGFGGEGAIGGTRMNVAGTPNVAGAGGRRMNNVAGAGGRHFGGAGGGFGGDFPVAGAPFGGQVFGGAGGAFGGRPFGGADFGGQGGAPFGGQGGAPFGGQAGAPFGGAGGASGGNGGSGGVSCSVLDSCPSCKPGICAPSWNNCAFANDIALSAEPSATHGGIGGYGPEQLNDGVGSPDTCHWSWVSNGLSRDTGAYFELDWKEPVTFQSVLVDTTNAAGEQQLCEGLLSGRNLAGGELQFWNGSGWTTAQTWDNQLDDFVISLPKPIKTTKIRLYNVYTSPSGNGNSLIFELYVASGPACGF